MSIRKLHIFTFLLLLLFSSCGNDKPNLKKDLSNIEKQEVMFREYANTLFSLNKDSFINIVPTLKNVFPLFLSENTEDTQFNS